jgi:hypothetical protein
VNIFYRAISKSKRSTVEDHMPEHMVFYPRQPQLSHQAKNCRYHWLKIPSDPDTENSFLPPGKRPDLGTNGLEENCSYASRVEQELQTLFLEAQVHLFTLVWEH